MTPTGDARIHRYVTRWAAGTAVRHAGPSTADGDLEVTLRLAGSVVAEIEAVRDADTLLLLLPPEALAASSRYLAELIVGRAPPPTLFGTAELAALVAAAVSALVETDPEAAEALAAEAADRVEGRP